MLVLLSIIYLSIIGVKMKVKLKIKYLAKIKRPEEAETLEQHKVITSYQKSLPEESKIKFFQPIQLFEY
jgi:hypothetical protein